MEIHRKNTPSLCCPTSHIHPWHCLPSLSLDELALAVTILQAMLVFSPLRSLVLFTPLKQTQKTISLYWCCPPTLPRHRTPPHPRCSPLQYWAPSKPPCDLTPQISPSLRNWSLGHSPTHPSSAPRCPHYIHRGQPLHAPGAQHHRTVWALQRLLEMYRSPYRGQQSKVYNPW